MVAAKSVTTTTGKVCDKRLNRSALVLRRLRVDVAVEWVSEWRKVVLALDLWYYNTFQWARVRGCVLSLERGIRSFSFKLSLCLGERVPSSHLYILRYKSQEQLIRKDYSIWWGHGICHLSLPLTCTINLMLIYILHNCLGHLILLLGSKKINVQDESGSVSSRRGGFH